MLRRRGGDVQAGARHAMGLPPGQLGDARWRDAPGFQVGADAERGDEGDVRFRQRADGRVVQVIVVVVRDHHRIDGGQLAQADRHRLEALRAEQGERRGSLAPDRIGQHAPAVDLQQHGGMAQPGGAQPAGWRFQPCAARVLGRQWRRRGAIGISADEVAQGGLRCGRIAQTGQHRMDIAQPLAVPQRQVVQAFETFAPGGFAERSHGVVPVVCAALMRNARGAGTNQGTDHADPCQLAP